MATAAQVEGRLTTLANRSANVARRGVDSLSAAVKIVSDLTAEELSMVIGMVRERVNFRPVASVIGFGGRAVTGVVEADKILLDLAAQETAVVVEVVKEGLRLRPAFAAIADLVPKGVETYVEVGKHFLGETAEEAEKFVDSYTEGKPLKVGETARKFARQQVEFFVDAQKKFLDQVNEKVAIATEDGGAPAERNHPRTMIQLTRDGIDKLIDAEKKILHVAIEHMEGPKGRERKAPPRTSLAELTQKSVQNFTDAQKSLLDLALRPEKETAEEPRKARKAPRRPAAKRVAAKAK